LLCQWSFMVNASFVDVQRLDGVAGTTPAKASPKVGCVDRVPCGIN
jgi:hypothetical protein